MKRAIAILIIACLGLISAPPARAGIGVRVSGGVSSISYDDYNDFVDYANDQVSLLGLSGEFENIKWLPEISAELLYDLPILPGASVGAGIGYLYGRSESSITAAGIVENTLDHKVKAYPFTLTGYYQPSVPFSPKPFVFAGAGLYKADLYMNVFPADETTWNKESELDAWGTGFHMGAGLEMSIIPMLSFELTIRGRWVDIDGFEGTGSYPAESGLPAHTVFLGVVREAAGVTGFGAQNTADKGQVEEASLDLSGYAVTAAIKFNF